MFRDQNKSGTPGVENDIIGERNSIRSPLLMNLDSPWVHIMAEEGLDNVKPLFAESNVHQTVRVMAWGSTAYASRLPSVLI